jgi:hypothetical protein
MLARECVMSSKLRTFPGSLITRRFQFVEDFRTRARQFIGNKDQKEHTEMCYLTSVTQGHDVLVTKTFLSSFVATEVGLRRLAFFNKPSIPMSNIFYAVFQALELFSIEQQLLC